MINAKTDSTAVPNKHINSQKSRITVNIRVIGNNNILSSIRIMKSSFSVGTLYRKRIPEKRNTVYDTNFK